jgi:hypothetical protein
MAMSFCLFLVCLFSPETTELILIKFGTGRVYTAVYFQSAANIGILSS